MTRGVSLRRNVAWAMAGNAGYGACQWGVLAVVARVAGAETLGAFAFGLALTGPVMTLANLHLRAVQATDARGEYPFGVYLGLRLVTVTLALVVIAAVALVLGSRGAALGLVLALALAKALEAVSDVVFGLLQRVEDVRRIALSLLLKGVLGVAAVAAVLGTTASIQATALALALAWGVVLVLWDLPGAARLARLRPRLEPGPIAGLAWLALPLGCVMGLNAFTVSVPRYAIQADLGPAALGHFAAIAYLFVAAGQPLLALGAAVTPRLARWFATDPPAYHALVARTVLVAGALGALGVGAAALAGRAVLALAYAPEYAAHAGVLVWMAVAAGVGFLASALGFSVTAARRFRDQLLVAVLALGGSVALSHLLVPRHGLQGAAWAVLGTETIRLLALAAVYARVRAAGRDAVDRAPARGPLRVLHVFGAMDRGGAETRTLEILRRLDREQYAFDFCVLSGEPGAYAPEIRACGAAVVPCALRPGAASFPLRFWHLLAAGRYDAVHSHVHHFSGILLCLARMAGVRTRIAHVRVTSDGRESTLRRRAYRAAMLRLIDRHATRVIGVSEAAMDAFWGPPWRDDPRKIVIYNGVETDRFAIGGGAPDVRREFGVPDGARVIVHVARFDPEKNHRALLAIARALIAGRRDVVFLLVGDGALRQQIRDDVEASGLAPWFRFAGARDDVARILAAADAFVFPSLWEGLPGAVLEALAAGLPVVASPLPGVLEIARRVPGLVTADPSDPAAFAARIAEALDGGSGVARPRLPRLFSTAASMERMLACYQ